jgi:hypothetical protein
MTRPRRIIGLCLVAILVAVAFYLYVGSSVPAGQPALSRLTTSNFAGLRTAFNEAKDTVRVVALLSPT